jgi:hypothetical protein
MLFKSSWKSQSMNPDVFAAWFRKQGQVVVRTPSSYWVNQGTRAFQAFPYHWLIEPTQNELDDFLKKYKAIVLRYSTPVHHSVGRVSYHAVFEDADYDFASLSKWARKNVRRGLSSCCVEPISFERLADEGFSLQLDTLNRQGRKLELAHSRWKTLCLAAADLPGFEAWGALVNGKLAASVITFRMETCYYMLYQQCLRQYLPENVNNALSFTVTQSLVRRAETKSILYGLHSLDAPSSVDEFKFRMGYIAKPVRQRVVFHPWLQPLANDFSHAITRKLLSLNEGNAVISKAEGMLRFYLQGNLNLQKQIWPECLAPGKEQLLNSLGN